jgi:hypothetical protein
MKILKGFEINIESKQILKNNLKYIINDKFNKIG